MSEWQEIVLTDIYEISSGLSKPADSFGSGYPFLSFKDVFNNYFVPDELSQLVESSESERLKCSIKRGDVFLTRTSETMHELGMSSVALKDHPDATFNGFTKRLRPKKDAPFDVHPEFIAYYLRSPKFRRGMLAFSTMSTRASLNNGMIGTLKIELPPIETQKYIARVLKSLDDKIKLNHQINQTLEQIAQAIFKSWFVDFEPVKAKIQAKQNGQDPERAAMRTISGKTDEQLDQLSPEQRQQLTTTAALFPDELEDSELGETPRGWNVNTMEEIVEIGSAKRIFAKEYRDSGVPFFRGKEITELSKGSNIDPEIFIDRERYEELKTVSGAPKGNDILITSVGTIGNTYLVKDNDEFYFKDGNLTWIKKYKREFIPYYLKTWFDNLVGENAIENVKIGSTQQAITIASINKIKLLLPTSEIHNSFHEIIESNYKARISNREQIQSLCSLRDVLLPKLLSGEITLGDTQSTAEAVA